MATIDRVNPDGYTSLRNLRIFSVSGNLLSGTLSSFFGSSWTNITNLQFHHNQFTGTLPSNWNNWNKLQIFSATDNLLTGSIPPEWSTWTQVRTLQLDRNQLSGSIPESFNLIKKLEVFSASYNQLTGLLPEWRSGWYDALFTIALDHNQLTGTLPATWAACTTCTVLVLIAMARRDSTGRVVQVRKLNVEPLVQCLGRSVANCSQYQPANVAVRLQPVQRHPSNE